MIDVVTMVVPTITSTDAIGRLVDRFSREGGVVGVSGLWGSSAPLVCARLFAALRRPILYVTPHGDEADEACDDLETFSGEPIDLLPAWETLPGQGSGSGEIHNERLRLVAKLRDTRPGIVVAPIQALMQPVPSPEALERHTFCIKPGQRRAPEKIVEWLIERKFERLDRVESPGDLALRGDILDIFPHDRVDPVRLEFLDDELEAVRSFDVSTQRSKARLSSLSLTAVPQNQRLDPNDETSFFGYLPSDAIVVLDRPGDVQTIGETLWERLDHDVQLIDPGDLLRRATDFAQLHITRVGAAVGSEGDVFHFDVRSLARFEGKVEDAVGELCEAAADHEVIVFCDNEGQRSRLKELIVERDGHVRDSIRLTIGTVHRGFEWAASRTIVVPHHEIFHRTAARRIRRAHASRPLESWLDLVPGDYVVHVMHGIARFAGMKTMRKGNSNKSGEFLILEFADKARLHVIATQIDLIQKYVGSGGNRPVLSKLGGTRWDKTKQRVTDAVSDLAEMLLRTQAERSEHEGIAYPADTQWQREFEDAFMYEDTEDQVTVAGEIKDDLRKPRPMDRLVCGDVGYGKTELAIRAAFKVVEFGKQVAVLVPTTVLAEQHHRTFRERLADYPFVIGCLSRFRTTAEQKKLINQTKKGQVDILIGTHRLLSKDIGFADLGLVIIDEEQRFGVEHKERLKRYRSTIDVLTLSATPIPRTLHMALVGLRDISSLQTPPMDRRAIATRVCPFDSDLIRDAVIRELNRDGQVYFIHNVVHSIEAMADRIRKLVPEAKVIVGHGQMKEHQLEHVMAAFVSRKADILVATTIVESGIDIPNVNTIFVNMADRYGLADLHQLRGRVGRSSHRGYCYFLLPPNRPVSTKAAKRLKAIEEFSDLGAGFRIAMRDLEIRGAGNLLGAQQSGHIAAVGYEMYCRILESAVRRQQGKPDEHPPPVHIELDIAAQIPLAYIPAERTRIDIYRRIAGCHTVADLDQLRSDLADAFGKSPEAMERLLDLAEIRVLAAPWKIRTIILDRPDMIFTVESLSAVDGLFANAPGTVRWPDPTTIHLRLPPNYLEASTLMAFLRRLLAKRHTEEVA